MRPGAVKRDSRSAGSAPWITSALVLACALFAATALFAPRAVRPTRLPILSLDPGEAREAMAGDAALAREAPHTRWSDELRTLYAELGQAAHEGPLPISYIRGRYRRAERLARAVRDSHGERGLWALRAEATARLWDALDGRLPEARRRALLGNFEAQLARHHARAESGARRAPKLVVWAMYKARWNAFCHLDATAGFLPVERQAYEGWLALHSHDAPAQLRHEAAHRYERAGGRHGAEAVGVWALRMGDARGAAEAFARALQTRRSVRVRNYALAAREQP